MHLVCQIQALDYRTHDGSYLQRTQEAIVLVPGVGVFFGCFVVWFWGFFNVADADAWVVVTREGVFPSTSSD